MACRVGQSNRAEADFEATVVFGPASTGSVALVIYEWEDAKLLGIDSDGSGAGQNEWEDQRIYVCTLAAMRANRKPSQSADSISERVSSLRRRIIRPLHRVLTAWPCSELQFNMDHFSPL